MTLFTRLPVSLGVIAATLALAAAPAPAEARDRSAEKNRLVPASEPVDCLSLTRIRSSRVLDDRTIDFETSGGTVYRNELPHSCPGLGFEERFAFRTSLSQLCSVDIITVLHSGGGLGLMQGASCGLGKFQPMAKAKR